MKSLSNAKTWLLIDGAGAFLTAVLLTSILFLFNQYIGMPPMILIVLIIAALIFCVYSISCFLFVKKNAYTFLLVISCVNLFYCCFTGWLVIYYSNILTKTGILYFILEIAVICILVFFELRAIRKNKKKYDQM